MNWIKTILLVSLALILAGCGTSNISAEDVQRIVPSEARALMDGGEAVLYDVRSAKSYHAKHALSAISLPEAKVDAHLGALPVDRELIFY